MEHLRPFSPKSRGRPSWGRVIRYPRIAVVRQGTNSTCNERQEGPRCGHLAQEHAARCTNGRSGEAAAQHQIDRRAAAKGRPRPRLYAAGAKYRDLKRGWLGLLAAVSRIATILPNDLAPTNMNGPYRPLTMPSECCGAARRTGHSLQAHNPAMVKVTLRGTKRTSTGVNVIGFVRLTPCAYDGFKLRWWPVWAGLTIFS